MRTRKLFHIAFLWLYGYTACAAQLTPVSVPDMHHIAEQYLRPETTQLEQIERTIKSIQTALDMSTHYQERLKLKQQLKNFEKIYSSLQESTQEKRAVLALYSDNDIELHKKNQTVIPNQDLAQHLYVTCGPATHTENGTSYNHKQRLALLLRKSTDEELDYTSTLLGDMKLAKTLGQPTADLEALRKKTAILTFFQKHPELVAQLEHHLARIAVLEDDVITFWNHPYVCNVLTHSPSFSNSTFAPIFNAAQEIEAVTYKNDGKTVASKREVLNKAPLFLAGVNYATVMADIQLMNFGSELVSSCWGNVGSLLAYAKNAITNISLGSLSNLAIPPTVATLTHTLCNYIINQALRDTLSKTVTNLIEQTTTRNFADYIEKQTLQETAITIRFSSSKPMEEFLQLLAGHEQLQGQQTEPLKICVTFQDSYERHLRNQHFLYRHNTAFVILSALVAYCLAYHVPITALFSLSWNDILQKLVTLPLIALPWALLKVVTIVSGVISTTVTSFLQKPRESIIFATQSIEKQRIAIQSLALLIDEMQAIDKLIKQSPELYNLLELSNHLDAEKSIKARLHARLLTATGALTTYAKAEPQLLDALQVFIRKNQQQLQDVNVLFEVMTTARPSDDSYKKNSLLKKIWHRFTSSTITAAYNIMLGVKEVFGLPLEALGELDMYVALTKLLQQHQEHELSYCIATFEEKSSPHLHATKVWNPLLQVYETPIVTNTIELGGTDNAQTAIISGATEGGKSTFLRTIANATLMALTLGIAPATSFTLTPPDKMCLSFNNQDNIGQQLTGSRGTSGFRSEVEQAKKLLETITTSHGHCFIFIDELFQRAQGASGEYGSSRFIEDSLLSKPNALSLVVTHREQPKHLENAGKLCRNYRFGSGGDTAYTLQRGAHLRPGFRITTLEDITDEEDINNIATLTTAQLIGVC